MARRDSRPEILDLHILKIEDVLDVDSALIQAVVAAESNFEPRAI